MADRVARIISRLDLGRAASDTLVGLCVGCVRELGVTGAGLALILDGEHRGTLGVSDASTGVVEELQLTCGEGPCLDAHRSRRAVFEPDLARSTQWPMFGPTAMGAGVRAVFALPLQVGAARFGAFTLYRDEPGPLDTSDLVDAHSLAGLATALVLMMQAEAWPGSLPESFDDLVDHGSVIHQAAGMISVQLAVAIEDATVALRAHAFATDRRIGDVATDVVARRIRFAP